MSIKIGWAEVDITPEKGTKIGLEGQFFERVTDEVESRVLQNERYCNYIDTNIQILRAAVFRKTKQN